MQGRAFIMGTHCRSVLSPVCKLLCVMGFMRRGVFDILQLLVASCYHCLLHQLSLLYGFHAMPNLKVNINSTKPIICLLA